MWIRKVQTSANMWVITPSFKLDFRCLYLLLKQQDYVFCLPHTVQQWLILFQIFRIFWADVKSTWEK